jgi:hypothetical protein
LRYLTNFSNTSPFSSLEALAEESIQKNEKAEKTYFYLWHNIKEKLIWSRFSARPDLHQSLTKTKKELRQSPILLHIFPLMVTPIMFLVDNKSLGQKESRTKMH